MADTGFELYPAQEEALLELMADRHVVLDTPTGSGKSLVALGLHFRGLCEGRRSFYTSPIKALASEKFFSLCTELGADNVGMLTGDASINPDASVICCTAEVLANLSLRKGEDLDAPYVVMDEFHYYADRDRGWAWQVPLITLPRHPIPAHVGHPRRHERHHATGRRADRPHSGSGPVGRAPGAARLHLSRDTRSTRPSRVSMEADKAPIYLVNFTQRDCAEMAQKLTSMKLTTKEEKAAIREAVGDTRFHTPYGKEFKRFLGFGIGVHHAGLLPKYRLQVEQLAQQGLLKVISGTDTLGVGINIPLRTVLFTKLAKFDGRKVSRLKVRDFKQIAGRAGRKGFDDRGQRRLPGPRRRHRTSEGTTQGGRQPQEAQKKGPGKTAPGGEVSWSEDTFKKLIADPPEKLHLTLPDHSRDAGRSAAARRRDQRSRQAATSTRCASSSPTATTTMPAKSATSSAPPSSRGRSIAPASSAWCGTPPASYLWVVVDEDLQVDFSLFHNLSLFLIEAIEGLDPENPEHALDLLSLVESVLEDPTIVLRRQVDRLKTELINRLKAEGVSYDERMNRLDEVTHPQPIADYIYAAFEHFRQRSPVGGRRRRAAQVGGAGDGRGLSGLHRLRSPLRSPAIRGRAPALPLPGLQDPRPERPGSGQDRSGPRRRRLLPRDARAGRHQPDRGVGIDAPPRAAARRRARRRKTAHRVLGGAGAADRSRGAGLAGPRRAPSAGGRARPPRLGGGRRHASGTTADEPSALVEPDDFSAAMEPFFADYEKLVFDHRARLAEHTQLTAIGDNQWQVVQVLLDPSDENLWCIEGQVDLSDEANVDGPLVVVTRIGT